MSEEEKKDLVARLRNYDHCNDSDVDEAANELEKLYTLISRLTEDCTEHRGKIDQLQHELTQTKRRLEDLVNFIITHPNAAKGMGAIPNGEWKEMQTLALEALDQVRQTKPEHWGCNCDLNPGESPDRCVFETGDFDDCTFVKNYKKKEDCPYWVKY